MVWDLEEIVGATETAQLGAIFKPEGPAIKLIDELFLLVLDGKESAAAKYFSIASAATGRRSEAHGRARSRSSWPSHPRWWFRNGRLCGNTCPCSSGSWAKWPRACQRPRCSRFGNKWPVFARRTTWTARKLQKCTAVRISTFGFFPKSPDTAPGLCVQSWHAARGNFLASRLYFVFVMSVNRPGLGGSAYFSCCSFAVALSPPIPPLRGWISLSRVMGTPLAAYSIGEAGRGNHDPGR